MSTVLLIRLSNHIFTSHFVQLALCVYSSADLQIDPRTFGCLGVAVENVGQFRVPAPPHRALVGAGLSTVNTSVGYVSFTGLPTVNNSVGVRIFYWPADSKHFSGVRIFYWPADSKHFCGGTYLLLACRQ